MGKKPLISSKKNFFERLWKTKLQLLYDTFMKYYICFEAYSLCHKCGNFREMVVKGNKIRLNINYKTCLSFSEKIEYFSNRYNLFNKNDVVNDDLIRRIISFNYSLPNKDYESILHHFTVFYCLCIVSPSYYNEITYKYIDLSLMQFIGFLRELTVDIIHKGDKSDKEFKRAQSIRKGKKKEERRILITQSYNKLQLNHKTTKHNVACAIRSMLGTQLQSSEVPSLDTIKRRLKDAKLPPFN